MEISLLLVLVLICLVNLLTTLRQSRRRAFREPTVFVKQKAGDRAIGYWRRKGTQEDPFLAIFEKDGTVVLEPGTERQRILAKPVFLRSFESCPVAIPVKRIEFPASHKTRFPEGDKTLTEEELTKLAKEYELEG